ncbi:tetratricopeptide repeat protein [Duganella sp. FT135W]|uniref:Tetratricopeptide repeat protein n=1 Tax=Duganella flavida TaxID=2692175 RepID=A0A6L8K7U6_9BURK|nr:tetratricopeptide repeat protein [Duganella flavida]MYM22617.1 tetratricopeptide repeat protein [Duganella flavida]
MNNQGFNYRSAINAAKWPEVVQQAQVDLATNPLSGTLWRHLAIALQAQQLDCVSAWENCARYLPAQPDVQLALGQIYLMTSRFDEAMVCYQHALRLDPKCAIAHFGCARALHARGDLNGAIARYGAALELRPHFEEALSGLGAALSLQTQLAQRAYTRVTAPKG